MQTPVSMVNQMGANDSEDQATFMAVFSSNSQAPCMCFISPRRFGSYRMNVFHYTLIALSLLNFDALHRAMSHLEFAGDIVRAMETCHSLHYAGFPSYFESQFAWIVLPPSTNSCSALRQTKTGASRILRHVEFARVLGFDTRTSEEMSISLDRITEILQNSHNLESLHLSIPQEELLNPGFRDALERLSCLRTLVVHAIGSYMMEILTGSPHFSKSCLACPVKLLQGFARRKSPDHC